MSGIEESGNDATGHRSIGESIENEDGCVCEREREHPLGAHRHCKKVYIKTAHMPI